MQAVRLIILSLLILALMAVYMPQSQAATRQAWEHARPDVVALMDRLYVSIRNFVAGGNPHEGIHDDAPGVDFDLIITMEYGGPL